MKKIYKYGTGQSVPDGAVYLSTVVQEMHNAQDHVNMVTQRFVWHYFLVETEK